MVCTRGMKLFGKRLPSTKIEPIGYQDVKRYHLGSGATILNDQTGQTVFTDLIVKTSEVGDLIAQLPHDYGANAL